MQSIIPWVKKIMSSKYLVTDNCFIDKTQALGPLWFARFYHNYGYSLAQSIRPLQNYFVPSVPDIHGLVKIARHACGRQADYVILFRDNFNWHIQLSDFVSNGLHEIGKLSVNVTPFFWLYFKMSDPKKDFQHIRLEFEVGLVEKPLRGH